MLQNNNTKLEIFSARKQENELLSKRTAGFAFLSEESDIYEIKLFMFPKHTYFLKRNYNSIDHYTVFSKRVLENNETKVLNPIGMGRLSKSVNGHIEVFFPLISAVVYIDLVPKNN
jgi:hypothetical protein